MFVFLHWHYLLCRLFDKLLMLVGIVFLDGFCDFIFTQCLFCMYQPLGRYEKRGQIFLSFAEQQGPRKNSAVKREGRAREDKVNKSTAGENGIGTSKPLPATMKARGGKVIYPAHLDRKERPWAHQCLCQRPLTSHLTNPQAGGLLAFERDFLLAVFQTVRSSYKESYCAKDEEIPTGQVQFSGWDTGVVMLFLLDHSQENNTKEA